MSEDSAGVPNIRTPATVGNQPVSPFGRLIALYARRQHAPGHAYDLSDDLLEGRGTGARGADLAATWIAAQFMALGLEPAGDSGTYFQNLPVVVRKYTEQSTLAVDGKALRWNTDFVATPARMPR